MFKSMRYGLEIISARPRACGDRARSPFSAHISARDDTASTRTFCVRFLGFHSHEIAVCCGMGIASRQAVSASSGSRSRTMTW